MPEERDCVVKLVDDHGVEHSVKVRASSVYEAALKGLTRVEKGSTALFMGKGRCKLRMVK
jgi:hypothetical protein